MNKDTLVISAENFCENNILMKLYAPDMAKTASPGQFLNILCSGDNKLVLRRPISIMDADSSKGYIDIAFEIRGEGTRLLSEFKAGDAVDVMGPLGNGFELNASYKKIAIVGGGIGIYPLYFLAKKYIYSEIDVFMGYQCADKIVLGEEFEREGCSLYLATDDGSAGYSGYITDLFRMIHKPGMYDMVFVCGPEVMSRKIVDIVKTHGGKCQVSLEERMGCGIGACLVCSCEVMIDGKEGRKTVCKDGPVFNGSDIFPEV